MEAVVDPQRIRCWLTIDCARALGRIVSHTMETRQTLFCPVSEGGRERLGGPVEDVGSPAQPSPAQPARRFGWRSLRGAGRALSLNRGCLGFRGAIPGLAAPPPTTRGPGCVPGALGLAHPPAM